MPPRVWRAEDVSGWKNCRGGGACRKLRPPLPALEGSSRVHLFGLGCALVLSLLLLAFLPLRSSVLRHEALQGPRHNISASGSHVLKNFLWWRLLVVYFLDGVGACSKSARGNGESRDTYARFL